MKHRILLATLAMMPAVSAATAYAQAIELTGFPPNGAMVINELGAIAGIRSLDGSAASLPGETLLWTPDAPNSTQGSLQVIAQDRLPRSINSSRHIVLEHPVTDSWSLWRPEQAPEPLPIRLWPGPGGEDKNSKRLNDAGQLVGYLPGAVETPGLWSEATGFQPLVGNTLPYFVASTINEYGQVFGLGRLVGGDEYPVLWTPDAPNGLTGTVTVVTAPDGSAWTYSRAYDLNDQGVLLVAGYESPADEGIYTWVPDVPNGATGSLQQILVEGEHLRTGELYNNQSKMAKLTNRRSFGFWGIVDGSTAAVQWIPDGPGSSNGSLFQVPSYNNNLLGFHNMNDLGQIIGWTSPSDWLYTPLLAPTGGGAVSGGNDGDLITGSDAGDSLSGNGGDDALSGDGGDDQMDGGVGDDVLSGGEGNDQLDGGGGADSLYGGAGDDVIDGGAGDDILFGGEGNDFLDCGQSDSAGNDTIDGGAGNDVLFGGQGTDTLIGGTGDDSIDGRSNADDIDAGPGSDVVLAGSGADTIRVTAGDVPAGGVDMVDGGTGADALVLTGFTAVDVIGATPDFSVVDPATGGLYEVTGVETIVYQ